MSKKVAWDYIVPIVMPKDLKGVEPGKLPESLLRPIPGGGKLHWLAANAWNAMVAKAKADGLELKPTSSGDLYRSYESQLASFKQRYVLEKIEGTSTKSFEGKTWYLKKGMAMLATPGKSNHNLGIAVDVHSAGEPKRLNWLIENVKDFGFSWEVVPSEPWHLRYVCGDNPPPAVVAFTSGQPVAAAPVASSTTATNAGDEKKKLQEALKEKGFYNGPIDGNIATEETQQAIKNFKLKNGLNADFVVGPKVKELLGLK
jgi:D-alanyl-D-alanine carboxypeptidase/Putative peptidoglycan binding domain